MLEEVQLSLKYYKIIAVLRRQYCIIFTAGWKTMGSCSGKKKAKLKKNCAEQN